MDQTNFCESSANEDPAVNEMDFGQLITQFFANKDIQEALVGSMVAPLITTSLTTSSDSGVNIENIEEKRLPSIEEISPLALIQNSMSQLFPPAKKVRKQKPAKSFCKVCKQTIIRNGQRSQGPRRHILQNHIKRPIFRCPLCPFTSFYDKAHVNTHLRRIHAPTEAKCEEVARATYAKEEKLWTDVCFGNDSTGEISSELKIMNKMGREEQRKPNVQINVQEGDCDQSFTVPTLLNINLQNLAVQFLQQLAAQNQDYLQLPNNGF